MNKRFLKLYIKNTVSHLRDYIQYDLLGPKPKNDMADFLPHHIEVKWSYDPKEKSYFAEAVEPKGIYSASNTIDGIVRNINVQVFEYYQVPHFHYRNMKNWYNPPVESLEALKEGRPKQVKFFADKNQPAYY